MVKAALLSIEKNIIDYVEEIKERFNITFILMKVVSADEALAAAREAEGNGADIIFSYGLMPLLNCEGVKLPVINLMLSGQDVAMLVKEAKDVIGLQRPNIALLLYSCMFRRETNVGELLEAGLKVYMLNDFADERQAVVKAAEDGAQIIVGIEKAAVLAKDLGIPALDIFSGKEGVLSALRYAELISQALSLEKKSAAENAAFMNSIFHGIIEINKNGDILRLNDYAKNLLDCKNRHIIGQPLLHYFPRTIKENLDAVLKTGQQIFTLDIKLRNNHMITNIEPIVSENSIIGAVITMQKGQYVHMLTPEMQNEVYSRGFRAVHRFDDFRVKSISYEFLIKQAKLAAHSNAPVLICGEEGTEALRLAQCIHNESSRRQGGFVEVECSAWETEHLDEMLFGQKNSRNSDNDSRTLIELAEDGTLFLNHVDALTNELQFRICRLIRGVLPLNNNRQISSDVRVIAATESKLTALMGEGKFRNDLFYALNVLTLEIPPLRERKEDIESWIDYFLDHYCSLYSRPIQLSRGACRCICEFPWPGNIRQLENFCHRMVLLTPRRNIDEAFVRDQLEQADQLTLVQGEQKNVTIQRDKNAAKILEALKQNGGNRSKTAIELGISKTTLWRLMQKHGITADYV